MKKFLAAMIVMLMVGLSMALAGCTDAERAGWGALGDAGHIICYSGGKVIYEGNSTGIIVTVDSSDGWEFEDAATHKFIRVSGQCVITN